MSIPHLPKEMDFRTASPLRRQIKITEHKAIHRLVSLQHSLVMIILYYSHSNYVFMYA